MCPELSHLEKQNYCLKTQNPCMGLINLVFLFRTCGVSVRVTVACVTVSCLSPSVLCVFVMSLSECCVF